MKMAQALIFSVVWMILSFMIGFIMIAQLVNNANASGAINGTAATYWNQFINYMWIGISILAMFPLVVVGLSFIGILTGGKESEERK